MSRNIQAEAEALRAKIARVLDVCDRIDDAARAWSPPHQHGVAWQHVVSEVRKALDGDANR